MTAAATALSQQSVSIPATNYWAVLVSRIQSGEQGAMADLYKVLDQGARFSFYRQFGPQDLDDKVHDLYVVILRAIQKDEIRSPDALLGYVRAVSRGQAAHFVKRLVRQKEENHPVELDHHPSPFPSLEQAAIQRERMAILMAALRKLPPREREILIRFHLNEEGPEEIQKRMGLSGTQYRLLKSRAKARFGRIAKQQLASQALHRRAAAITGGSTK